MNETLDKSWDFWREIVCNEDGSLNEEQVKKELHDFWLVMRRVTVVYDHITGGQFSKLLYEPKVIIDAAEEHYEKMFEHQPH